MHLVTGIPHKILLNSFRMTFDQLQAAPMRIFSMTSMQTRQLSSNLIAEDASHHRTHSHTSTFPTTVQLPHRWQDHHSRCTENRITMFFHPSPFPTSASRPSHQIDAVISAGLAALAGSRAALTLGGAPETLVAPLVHIEIHVTFILALFAAPVVNALVADVHVESANGGDIRSSTVKRQELCECYVIPCSRMERPGVASRSERTAK